ncbi:Cys-tRNA(Pro) deacylase [Roseateles asaccharophilus]|uniref:Cys-tRNA(Pro)/Cys-tRNA(Cys) deacylase n=1 Tax=Roseateles asaccharophilus TaxID=582607 RepID=A0ABU2A2A1_9BURK|nr:Cys-tRNA(Pro) deacylase [Roseateles asaccharophilus]MDR7331305.1 Cys-tRNA(Pro) deacylase [Roseateles asaccharophilus]
MSKKSTHVSETPATQMLKRAGVVFTEHIYDYVEHGGTAESSKQLGVEEHAVVKTLVMQDEKAEPLIVLMHGDRTVSLKELARQIPCKKVEPCKPDVAQRHSGYQVGGTSPFGVRKAMPVFVESTILQLDKICINGGRRGYLVGIAPQVLTELLGAKPVSCANAA